MAAYDHSYDAPDCALAALLATPTGIAASGAKGDAK